MKIVSTTCSNTEIVSALGCQQFIVGVDDYSDYPPEVVEPLPRVGPDLGIDVQAVVALKPDLVLASLTVPGHEKVVESLGKAGLQVFAPETIGLDHVYRDIADIANLLDVPARGDWLIEDMKEALTDRRSMLPKTPSIMVQWWPKPIIGASRRSWVHDLIELAGGRNALETRNDRSTPLEDDDPDLVSSDGWVISWCGVKLEKYRPEVLYERETLQNCAAVTERTVFSISEEFLGRPSPRLIEGYHQLCAVVDQLNNRAAGSVDPT